MRLAWVEPFEVVYLCLDTDASEEKLSDSRVSSAYSRYCFHPLPKFT